MSRVVYEEELKEVEVTKGIIPLVNRSKKDGKIISMEEAIKEEIAREYPDLDLESVRIEIGDANDVINEDSYEDEVAEYKVYKDEKIQVPYKVEEELIDKDYLTEQESLLSEEEKKQVVLDRLRNNSIIDGDDSLYDVVFTGVSDESFDMPLEEYEVYKITSKTPLEEDIELEEEIDNNLGQEIRIEEDSKEEEEDLKKTLEYLKEMKSKLESIENLDEQKELIDELYQREENIEKALKDDREEKKNIDENELKDLDAEIKKVQKNIKEKSQEYDKIYKELQSIIDEQREKLENSNLLSEEELKELFEFYDNKKLEVNDKSVRVSQEIEKQRKKLSALKTKKTKLEKDTTKARELNLSYDEYKEIQKNAINKKNTLNSILIEKGLEDIVSKTKKERTKEEQAKYEAARDEVTKEISEAMDKEEISVLDAVEFLYAIKKGTKKGEPREIAVSQDKIENIKENIKYEPEKIKADTDISNIEYTPGKAPEELVKSSVLTSGLVHIDDIYLRGLNKEETEEKYREEIIKDLEDKGFDYDPDTMDINIVGAESSEAESDILYTKYEIVEKELEKPKTMVLTDGLVHIDDIYLRGLNKEETEEKYREEIIKDLESKGFNYDPDTMTINIVGAESSEAESDILYTRYEIIGNEKEDTKEDIEDEEETQDDIEDEEETQDDDERELEVITLYREINTNDIYVASSVVGRFGFVPVGESISVEGSICQMIDEEDADYIIANQENEDNPYLVEIVEIELDRTKDDDIKDEVEEEINTLDTIVLYRDIDTGNVYAIDESYIDRFNLHVTPSDKYIYGNPCFMLDEEETDEIIANQGDSYIVEIRDYKFEKENAKENDDEEDNDKEITTPVEEKDVETIYLYRDVDSDNIYIYDQDIIDRFKLNVIKDGKTFRGKEFYRVDEEDVDDLIANQDNEENPYIIEFRNIEFDKEKEETNDKNSKSRPHEEAIINKLTQGLDIRKNDSKKYNASNIKVSKKFKDELHSGNYLYNIVHIVPNMLKAGINFLTKISSKLLQSKRGKESMETLQKRLEDLSEEELEVLFERYRGSRLKTDMNTSIDSLILARLRKYGLEKVEKLNDNIKDNYTLLFSLLGEIKALEKNLVSSELKKSEIKAINDARKKLMKQASTAIQEIENDRDLANNLLSGGIHGLEEDFKAVSTKMNYVGLRFAKRHNFDNELQEKLGKYGQGLNDAIASGNDEEVVNNFMALESEYYNNTKISGSLAGKRSVGTKYYTPLAEQFNYNNDPFLRDIFTTVAITSAVIGAVNAVRVHEIEQGKILSKQQSDANRVNAHNDQVMDQVHEVGQKIESHRGTFQKGMEAQVNQDVLNNANALERKALDYTDWTFNDAYHTMDHEHHEFFNAFNDNVQSQINDVTSKYSTGSITQADALQQMADIARDSQHTLAQVSDECLQILRPYAETHPQFDLTAVQESMEYIVANPDAIANMNQGMVEVTELASALQGLSVEHVAALSKLPSDMLSTLVCAASATALALNVSNTMDNKYGKKKRKYGNDITDMMGEYVKGLDEEEEEKEKVA